MNYIRILPIVVKYCTIERLLLKDQGVIVPSAVRSEMKSKLHQGHLGMTNCKKRACQALFWPLTNKELEEMISKSPLV